LTTHSVRFVTIIIIIIVIVEAGREVVSVGKQHDMKACKASGIKLHIILTLPLDGSKRSTSRFGRVGCSGSVLDMYFGGIRFEYWSGQMLILTEDSVVFFTSCRKMLG
jgi:hypothetical protein